MFMKEFKPEREREIGGTFQANDLIISVYRISLEDLSSAH
jgi:hypothetical protein